MQRRSWYAHAADSNHVQDPVGVAIAMSVQAVADGLARRGRYRHGPSQVCKDSLVSERDLNYPRWRSTGRRPYRCQRPPHQPTLARPRSPAGPVTHRARRSPRKAVGSGAPPSARQTLWPPPRLKGNRELLATSLAVESPQSSIFKPSGAVTSRVSASAPWGTPRRPAHPPRLLPSDRLNSGTSP